MKSISIGLLPLYLELYDNVLPEMRPRLDAFYDTIADLFEQKGIRVFRSQFCRIAREFSETITRFEDQGVDCIVTLHMAYSPSLEAIDALVDTSLPVVVLDTTQAYFFGAQQNPDEINYNHGIHGVMDLCNLLKKRGKPYSIAAGHYEQSDVLNRALKYIKASVAARSLRGMKVGSIGGNFDGMGDFLVKDDEMHRRFGVDVIRLEDNELYTYSKTVTSSEIFNISFIL